MKRLLLHFTINHQEGYVRGKVHTNGIESFWALLKRGYYGIYHHMSSKHLQKYINEFSHRFNRKDTSIVEQVELAVQSIVGIRLTYEGLTYDNTI